MTLTQLEIFSVVVELGGFTSAAARLGIGQSAVSHAIRALEQELGVELLHRNKARVEPSDIGHRLLERARAMLGLAETMRQEATAARGMKLGTLRIGSFGPSASIRLLPAILQRFRQDYPGIQVLIDEGPDRQVLQWLHERRVDLGFVVLPQHHLDTVPLFEDQLVAVLPTNHPLATQQTVELAQLCDHPFVLTEAGSAELVDNLFRGARLQPDIRYRCSQLISTLDTVARGDALTVVAELSVPEGNNGRYCIRPLHPAVPRQVGLALLDHRQASPAAQAFIELATRMHRDGLLGQLMRVGGSTL
ncbi:LysR family transcriptional regulator [Pseudomonas sp. ML96]|uniref:LysR family transcriptional regulator n=1 Tax=Pseudomonas sp. ML96 TaxID=1523503 RepID=UPI000690D5C4|nr:LysR substrate-binding domain-containing protein [Pseudomonas sp. ML96]